MGLLMKATEIKYMLLLNYFDAKGYTTYEQMSEALGMPAGLVHRYTKRLEDWGALIKNNGDKGQYQLSAKGRQLLRRASWEFLACSADPIMRLRSRAIQALKNQPSARRIVLYGATPMTGTLGEWAQAAGLSVVAVCDEERSDQDALSLDELTPCSYDAFLLCNWRRAEDAVLLALLEHYAPVINLFAVDGAAVPQWS
jgi:predicted transcriptional regulator